MRVNWFTSDLNKASDGSRLEKKTITDPLSNVLPWCVAYKQRSFFSHGFVQFFCSVMKISGKPRFLLGENLWCRHCHEKVSVTKKILLLNEIYIGRDNRNEAVLCFPGLPMMIPHPYHRPVLNLSVPLTPKEVWWLPLSLLRNEMHHQLRLNRKRRAGLLATTLCMILCWQLWFADSIIFFFFNVGNQRS